MYYVKPFVTHYANTLDAFVPEWWANESVAILVENQVAANLVHRDFEFLFANAGDIVNTRKPGEFTAKRKSVADDVTIQDASATNIAVPLDQHVHTSFLIRDGEETKSFKSLVDEYLRPATISLARFVDKMVLGQAYQFLDSSAGSLGGLTSSNAVTLISNARNVMNKNNAHMEGRHIIWTPDAETKIIQNAVFHEADKLGDDGTALREASIGRKLGFQHWMAQNMSEIAASGETLGSGKINNVGGYPAGTTALTVDAFGADEMNAGNWVSINGIPYLVVTINNDTPTVITLEGTGLREAVADDDDVVGYIDGNKIDLAAGYAVGFDKEIKVDNGSGDNPLNPLQVGQMVSFGDGTAGTRARYTVMEITVGATEDDILLDRPLEKALVDNDEVNYGPEAGGFNFAFHRNAMTLVIRPLQLPQAGTGARAANASFNGGTMRVVITYDGTKQGHLVTLDFLAGVKVLDTDLGAVVLS